MPPLLRVLILGSSGQLGRELQATAPPNVDPIVLGRHELDIADAAAVEAQVRVARPDVILNAAAYTAVDRAESAHDEAFRVNAIGAGVVAAAAGHAKARLVYVSTDFVFDGAKGTPYQPDDATNPLNVYGASKLEGERRVLETVPNAVVVRTAWLYAAAGHNFVRSVLERMQRGEDLRVVADQVGTPTSARSLAHMLWSVVDHPSIAGILHFTDAGVASWYDVAVAVHEEALTLGLVTRPVNVTPIATHEYPTAARRPAFSVLDKTATYERLAITPRHWRVCLREMLAELPRPM